MKLIRYMIIFIPTFKEYKMAKAKKLTKEDIEAINKVALNKLETMEVTSGRKSEKQDFLLEIKEVINKAINKNIPFTQTVKMIKELYNISISTNMLKTFAINHLDYSPKKRSSKAKTTNKADTKATADTTEKATVVNGRIKSNFDDI